MIQAEGFRSARAALHPVPPGGGRREVWLDAVRGAAIVLMIVDHALGFAQTTDLEATWMAIIRGSVTRLAMPAFMICSGILVARRPLSRRRWSEVAAAALLVNVAAAVVGMGAFVPDILALWCVVMLFASPIRRWPVACAALGLLQSAYLPVPIDNFQPGWVLAFVALGVLAEQSGRREPLPAIGERLPSWTAAMGRHPLAWYLGHLAVLAGLTLLGSGLGWW